MSATPSVGLFRPWLHSAQASSSTDDAGLDACIIRYATARRACFGAPCDDCLDSLDQIGAECVERLERARLPDGSARGQRFIEHFREYRYADVGMQCLRSITVPDFERADEVTCGSATVSARAHAANPPPSLPLFFCTPLLTSFSLAPSLSSSQTALDIGCASYLVTESIAVCEAACGTSDACAGFVRVDAGLPRSGGPLATDIGVGACFFHSNVDQINQAESAASHATRGRRTPPRYPAYLCRTRHPIPSPRRRRRRRHHRRHRPIPPRRRPLHRRHHRRPSLLSRP